MYSSVRPSLKVETWLRLKGIPYENIYTLRFGRKGQIPYIEMNGEQIPDSNVIIKRLAQHFNVKPDESFNPEQGALGHTVVRMIENHTCKGESDFLYVIMRTISRLIVSKPNAQSGHIVVAKTSHKLTF